MEKMKKILAQTGSIMAGKSQYYNPAKNEITFLVEQELPALLVKGFLQSNSANKQKIRGTMHGSPENILMSELFRGFYPERIKKSDELIKWIQENPCDVSEFETSLFLVKVYTCKEQAGVEPVKINGVLQYAHPIPSSLKWESKWSHYTGDLNLSSEPRNGFVIYSRIHTVNSAEFPDVPRILIDETVYQKAESAESADSASLNNDDIAKLKAMMSSMSPATSQAF